jgi:lipopolysaccharide transport system ATP-binding protein
MTEFAIRVENLGKCYLVGHNVKRAEGYVSLRDVLARSVKNVAKKTHDMLSGRPVIPGDSVEDFWALRNVTFDVRRGERVGIIGGNGAGKSTLLKILSRITEPTTGRVEMRGRVASLLEVGTGFHPELSGRENIFLNGTILGMTRAEVQSRFDAIVAFAEIERFIDTPVKRYSSGMYVRLAFSVAASLEADVLIVDEVLAVGDASFQEKCLAKMNSLSDDGRTILFVSHNLPAVSRLCDRAILLEGGEKQFDGEVAAGIGKYFQSLQSGSGRVNAPSSGPLTTRIELRSFEVNGKSGSNDVLVSPSDEIEMSVAALLKDAVPEFRAGISIYKESVLVLGLHDVEIPKDLSSGEFESSFNVPSYFLSPGRYTVDVNMYSQRTGEWMVAKNCGLFTVATEWHPLYEPTHAMGIVNLRQAGRRRVLEE